MSTVIQRAHDFFTKAFGISPLTVQPQRMPTAVYPLLDDEFGWASIASQHEKPYWWIRRDGNGRNLHILQGHPEAQAAVIREITPDAE